MKVKKLKNFHSAHTSKRMKKWGNALLAAGAFLVIGDMANVVHWTDMEVRVIMLVSAAAKFATSLFTDDEELYPDDTTDVA